MSTNPQSSNAAMLGRLEASIMAESALIDKESGRIFWEGGSSSTLSGSLVPKVGELGFSHFKATVLTSLLLLSLISFVAHYIRQRLDLSAAKIGTSANAPGPTPLYQTIALFLLQWTLLRTPRFDGSFVVCIFLLYLLEAHTSSTRLFLANAITSPTEVEEYIERLRSEAPVVTWKVRCFHYEKPYWLSPLKSVQAVLNLFTKIRKDQSTTEVTDQNLPFVPKESENVSGPFKRKVISHKATENYTFNSFVDETIAGVWKRQISTSNEAAPFMKIVLSKILVLADENARNDYFKQQSKFVTTEGLRDKFAEYSTNIEVPGFKRRMLAIRPVKGHPSAKLFRLNTFWVFTLLGLSLPYRIWFARHCDQLRVVVVKETHAQTTPKSTFSSWFLSTKPPAPVSPAATTGASTEIFRQHMQSMLLYARQGEEQAVPVEMSASVSSSSIATINTTRDKEIPDSDTMSLDSSRSSPAAIDSLRLDSQAEDPEKVEEKELESSPPQSTDEAVVNQITREHCVDSNQDKSTPEKVLEEQGCLDLDSDELESTSAKHQDSSDTAEKHDN